MLHVDQLFINYLQAVFETNPVDPRQTTNNNSLLKYELYENKLTIYYVKSINVYHTRLMFFVFLVKGCNRATAMSYEEQN
jgi:hypothetical protein